MTGAAGHGRPPRRAMAPEPRVSGRSPWPLHYDQSTKNQDTNDIGYGQKPKECWVRDPVDITYRIGHLSGDQPYREQPDRSEETHYRQREHAHGSLSLGIAGIFCQWRDGIVQRFAEKIISKIVTECFGNQT